MSSDGIHLFYEDSAKDFVGNESESGPATTVVDGVELGVGAPIRVAL